MADKTYDAIVVGGGHQGTIIACYLQHAGLQTVIFERQHELGGGACGEALPLPGFLQNPCAHFTRFYGIPHTQISTCGPRASCMSILTTAKG